MNIQSYQIHNVLDVYRRQLSQSKRAANQNASASSSRADSVSLSNEGKNHAIMEKVTASVIEKITSITPEAQSNGSEQATIDRKHEKPSLVNRGQDNTFTFHTIVGKNNKETRSISIGNSEVLMNRLDELAKAAINRNKE